MVPKLDTTTKQRKSRLAKDGSPTRTPVLLKMWLEALKRQSATNERRNIPNSSELLIDLVAGRTSSERQRRESEWFPERRRRWFSDGGMQKPSWERLKGFLWLLITRQTTGEGRSESGG